MPAAGRDIHSNHLLITAQLTDWNRQGHQMDIEAALRILAWRPEFEQIKNRLDVGKKAIVALACKSDVAVAQVGDRLRGVTIQLCFRGDTIARRVFTIVSLI